MNLNIELNKIYLILVQLNYKRGAWPKLEIFDAITKTKILSKKNINNNISGVC